MRFRFDSTATVEAAAYLLKKAGGSMNYTVLLKLLYLADRERIRSIDSPITGASYCSMPYGPVLSEVLNAINGRGGGAWRTFISKHGDHDVRLEGDPGIKRLSRGDIKILDGVFALGGNWTHNQAIRYCHRHIPEWHEPSGEKKSLPLPVEDILIQLGRTPEEIEQIRQDVEHYNREISFIEAQ